MHRTIAQYSPRQPRRKIHLRNAQGLPATPEEAKEMIRDYVQATWAGPAQLDMPAQPAPGVPFSQDDLLFELQHIPHNKAVARPFTPGLLITSQAQAIAQWLYWHLNQ